MQQSAKEISVGIIGLGFMGKGLLHQTIKTPGIKTVAVCDIDLEKARGVLREFRLDYLEAERSEDLERITAAGKIALFKDGLQFARASGIDAVIEATGTIIQGGEYAVEVLESGKHLIMMNSEADLAFGPYLSRLADERGVVYTSCDGDQYGVLMHLISDLRLWGFELVSAGNMKGFLDRYANPTSIITEADKRKLDYRACASYTDGSKLNIEMALVSNALGLKTKTPGMLGPRCADVDEVQSVFDFESLWRDKKPFVDYVLGALPGGGIYAVGYCGDPYQRDMMKYYKMGDGPFYTFYRPYHLCHIESMRTVFDAVLRHRALMKPDYGFVTNVYSYAKKDLKKGDMLDGIGGYACYGLIENCRDQSGEPGIPICLADRVSLKRDVKKDEKIFLSDVLYDEQRIDYRLFGLASDIGAAE